MSDQIYRYEVPVDDQWHWFDLTGVPLAVACRQVDVVEFWALHTDLPPLLRRRFRVVGTGQPLPDGWRVHWGTAVAPGGSLVWHLIEGKQP